MLSHAALFGLVALVGARPSPSADVEFARNLAADVGSYSYSFYYEAVTLDTYSPSGTPTASPTAAPTARVTALPTAMPTAVPTAVPIPSPTTAADDGCGYVSGANIGSTGEETVVSGLSDWTECCDECKGATSDYSGESCCGWVWYDSGDCYQKYGDCPESLTEGERDSGSAGLVDRTTYVRNCDNDTGSERTMTIYSDATCTSAISADGIAMTCEALRELLSGDCEGYSYGECFSFANNSACEALLYSTYTHWADEFGDSPMAFAVETGCECVETTLTPTHAPTRIAPGTCNNTDNGATDRYGDSCSDSNYQGQNVGCGSYDDDDFSSNEMCCTCGGGDWYVYVESHHSDYCYLCSNYSVNCEEYCYSMDECPDQWCAEGGCDWGCGDYSDDYSYGSIDCTAHCTEQCAGFSMPGAMVDGGVSVDSWHAAELTIADGRSLCTTWCSNECENNPGAFAAHTYETSQHSDYCYLCSDHGGNCEEYCYSMDECPDQWCQEGGCDWGCDGDDEEYDDDYETSQHSDYCYLCSDQGGNCEQYCYSMDECPDLWCAEGGCDWGCDADPTHAPTLFPTYSYDYTTEARRLEETLRTAMRELPYDAPAPLP